MKTKRALINYITDFIPMIIISFLGIFKLKYFITYLGDQTLALYQLFSQIMVYIALVDGGLSSAVLYALYKPNKENNKEALNSILAAAHKVFSGIGIIVFTIATLISLIVPFFIKDSSFPYYYVVVTFLLFSISNVISYFFVPYQTLLEVKEKKYIVNLSLQIGQILQNVLEIVLLVLGFNFIEVIIMHILIKIVSNVAVSITCVKIYPEFNFKSKEKDYSFTKQIKHLIFHKINGLVGSNIDTIIISKLLGLTSVAIYSTYNYIVKMLDTIFCKISSATLAIIGNSLSGTGKKSTSKFYEFTSLMFFGATVVCVPLALSISKFIDIWYEGEILTSIYIAFSFSLQLFMVVVTLPIVTYINALGLFKETKKCALIDTVVNLVLSLILVNFIGIPGVIVATAISYFISTYLLRGKVLFNNAFEDKYNDYFFNNIKLFSIFIIDMIVSYFILRNIPINGLLEWFVLYIMFGIINLLLIFAVYILFREDAFLRRMLNSLMRKLKGNRV